ncbi:hypothetical protein [Lactobacillus sp. Sy-1]|uniref:hypothetical protein n=1 Tax=Lactobacillus sp. Sy-1 TaxID=2109645 RepID=UPI001C5B515F|nr:hypothetical protein [Lactobacillus sp. Sy-1]MBW1606325.1 hypothetical protein [Lactobacillus sp. Sy-1]
MIKKLQNPTKIQALIIFLVSIAFYFIRDKFSNSILNDIVGFLGIMSTILMLYTVFKIHPNHGNKK